MVTKTKESPISVESLHKQVIDYIIDAIGTEKLRPGAKVNELTLSRDLNISRAPVREAIRELAVQGILTLEPRKGATVPELDKTDIRETYSLRACLESMAVGLVVERLTDRDIKKLETLSQKIDEALEKDNVKKFIKFNEEFHEVIRNKCGHAKLLRILKSLLVMSRLYLLMADHSMLINLKLDFEFALHDDLLGALRKRDAAQAEQLMKQHIINAGERLIAVLEEKEQK